MRQPFIPEDNESGRRACTAIWRLSQDLPAFSSFSRYRGASFFSSGSRFVCRYTERMIPINRKLSNVQCSP